MTDDVTPIQEQILAAATKVAEARGFHAITHGTAAKQEDWSRSTVANHYPTKAHLLTAVAIHLVETHGMVLWGALEFYVRDHWVQHEGQVLGEAFQDSLVPPDPPTGLDLALAEAWLYLARRGVSNG